jgi:CheY-like chemotaxis protein
MATVLVVDDDAAVRRLVVATLQQAGYTVVSASNGLEALMLYASYATQIDLVITDVQMPEMNGVELAARIRATASSTKVLLMSGCLPAEVAHLPEGYPLLCKPFGAAQLLTAAQGMLCQLD